MSEVEEREFEVIKPYALSSLAKKAKVLVATPNYTNELSSEVHANHLECAVNWTKWGLDFNMTLVGRTFVHFARSQMVDIAIRGGYSHIFWLDDDAVVDPYMLPRFIDHDKDCVLAPYPMRRPAYEIGALVATAHKCEDCGWYGFLMRSYKDGEKLILEHDQGGASANGELGPPAHPLKPDEIVCPKCDSRNMWRDFHNHASYKNISSGYNLNVGMMEIDGGGTHAMLVKVESFYAKGNTDGPSMFPPEVEDIMKFIKDNLNEEQRDKYDHYLGDLPDQGMSFCEENDHGKPFFIMPKQGTEDMLWCYRAKRKGIEIWCDTDVFAAHVGFSPVITKGFRDQVEKMYMPTAADRNSAVGPVQLITLDKDSKDGTLPVRKPAIHVGRSMNVI